MRRTVLTLLLACASAAPSLRLRGWNVAPSEARAGAR